MKRGTGFRTVAVTAWRSLHLVIATTTLLAARHFSETGLLAHAKRHGQQKRHDAGKGDADEFHHFLDCRIWDLIPNGFSWAKWRAPLIGEERLEAGQVLGGLGEHPEMEALQAAGQQNVYAVSEKNARCKRSLLLFSFFSSQ